MEHVIRNVPVRNRELRLLIQATVKPAGGTVHAKGRGPRPGGRYHASLPLALSERCSLYVRAPGQPCYKKLYWDFKHWDVLKGKPHVVLSHS